MEDEAVDIRVVVSVYWSWRSRLRALWSEDADRDVRMLVLPTHLYSGLSKEALIIDGLCSRSEYIRI